MANGCKVINKRDVKGTRQKIRKDTKVYKSDISNGHYTRTFE